MTLNCRAIKKQTKNKLIRIAYQCPIKLKYKIELDEEEAIPYTFEDSLALTNIDLFRGYDHPKALLKKIKESLNKETLQESNKECIIKLTEANSNKAEMLWNCFI